MLQLILRWSLFLVCTTYLAGANTDDQITADVGNGTFSNPSALLRPRFRYWLPDLSVEEAVVRDDIKSSADIGAGGVEFLPFYNAGGVLGGAPPGANWSKYGFGTPESIGVFVAALEAHRTAGLVMDIAIGPDQGQGVPAKSDYEGLQWDLIPSTATVPTNGSFCRLIPGWGSGNLVALVSAQVLSLENIPNSTSSMGVRLAPYSRLILKHDTLIDRTSVVSSSGYVSLVFPRSNNVSNYLLFAFYQRPTHHKNLEFRSNLSETIFDNGSYKVDHFSARGAEVAIKFWEEHILKDKIKSLLSEVGNYGRSGSSLYQIHIVGYHVFQGLLISHHIA